MSVYTSSLPGGQAFLSQHSTPDCPSVPLSISQSICGLPLKCTHRFSLSSPLLSPKVSVPGVSASNTDGVYQLPPDEIRSNRRSADWKEARIHFERGLIYEGKVEGFVKGGLRIRFHSLVGFLPFPELSPSHQCKEPNKNIKKIASGLVGCVLPMKAIQVSEELGKLIFSEKEAMWARYSTQIKTGDIFEGRVRFVEDFGALIGLRFPDGHYHLAGFVHVSEVSWDTINDARDVLTKGDEVRVKVLKIHSDKSRISLSIKQLEEDPLLETLDKVIPMDSTPKDGVHIEPLPEIGAIIEELMQEEGIHDIKLCRQGVEKRVVSQGLQLWISNEPQVGEKMTMLARAGRQVQEIQLRTSLNQEGVKMALQRVLERIR